MPLILDPAGYSDAILAELVRSLTSDLAETREFVLDPGGPVRDPASLQTAREQIDATLAILARPGDHTAANLAAEANLAYATMLSVIDLVKSHTDVPQVPAHR